MSDEFPNVDVSNGGDATNTCTPTTCVSLLPERWYWGAGGRGDRSVRVRVAPLGDAAVSEADDQRGFLVLLAVAALLAAVGVFASWGWALLGLAMFLFVLVVWGGND